MLSGPAARAGVAPASVPKAFGTILADRRTGRKWLRGSAVESDVSRLMRPVLEPSSPPRNRSWCGWRELHPHALFGRQRCCLLHHNRVPWWSHRESHPDLHNAIVPCSCYTMTPRLEPAAGNAPALPLYQSGVLLLSPCRPNWSPVSDLRRPLRFTKPVRRFLRLRGGTLGGRPRTRTE